MHRQKVRGISAARDAIWIVIGLIDELLADDIPADTKALLMRLRGDELGLLRVLHRAENHILEESRPSR
jgi:hypothetical protein